MASASSPPFFSVCASCVRKEKTAYKKAQELSTLCGIDVCLICYDSNNNLTFWPANQPEKVREMAKRFTELPEMARRKRSVSARHILEAKGICIFSVDPEDNPNSPNEKRQKAIKSNSTFSPDDHSSQRLKEALASLRLKLGSIDEAKPMKEHQQQQQLSMISSEPVPRNQDLVSQPVTEEIEYSDLFGDEADQCNPNLWLSAEECAAMLEEEETWKHDIDISKYLQEFENVPNN